MMRSQTLIQDALEQLFKMVSPTILGEIGFEAVDPTHIDWYLARLSYMVQPAYLPFASEDSGLLCLYLRPQIALLDCPIVYIPNDGTDTRFICESVRKLPTGLWLWIADYFKQRTTLLRRNLEGLADSIPDAQLPSEQLWELLARAEEYQPSWWHDTCHPTTETAWELAHVGHPFVGLPQPFYRSNVASAIDLLQPFVEHHREPELLSVLLSAQIKAGISVAQQDVLALFTAEAWRENRCFFRRGRWRVKGEGICAWDAVLSNLPNAERLLGSTEFADLATHPTAYRTQSTTLFELAIHFQQQEMYPTALAQARNAARVDILMKGKYDAAVALLSAELCDAIRPDSLAAVVARRTVTIDRDDL